MECPHCRSKEIKELPRKTDLGYAVFQRGGCRRVFNERTGTPAEQLRRKRKHKAGKSWYVDETYSKIKVKGNCCYLYRAIDRDGQLVDSMLSRTRDMAAAQRFFRKALATVGQSPERVTTDGHGSYPRAIEEVLGEKVKHRCNQYLNNRLEQDHRGIKQRYYPMLSFRAFRSAQRFCSAFDELRNYFRHRRVANERVSLGERRQQFSAKTKVLQTLFVG